MDGQTHKEMLEGRAVLDLELAMVASWVRSVSVTCIMITFQLSEYAQKGTTIWSLAVFRHNSE